MIKTKEKTITFRHYKYAKWVKNSITDAKVKKDIIEKELSRGYVPANMIFSDKETMLYGFTVKGLKGGQKIRQVYYYAAYAGKKSAREIGYIDKLKFDKVYYNFNFRR